MDQSSRTVRFHVANKSNSPFVPGRRPYLKFRDLGLTAATGGRVRAQLMTAENSEAQATGWHYHTCQIQMVFMLEGWADMEFDGGKSPVKFLPGDCSFVPGGIPHNELRTSDRIVALEISLPDALGTVACPQEAPSRIDSPGMFRRFSAAASVPFVASDNSTSVRDYGLTDASGGVLRAQVTQSEGAPAGGANTPVMPIFPFVCSRDLRHAYSSRRIIAPALI